jgi:benzylsuccinate CoA-transferase BbsF subunit
LGERALLGLRVIELGRGVAAPFCARLLADHGADVIKVEAPPQGDVSRAWGPFPGGAPDPERCGVFEFLNAGKRGIALDPARAEQRAILLELIERADALVDDHRTGELSALGLSWPELALRNPELVMISLTPFGLTGPYADWKGCDLNAYHLTATGHRYCGRPDAAPLEQGTFAAEFFAGYAAAAWGLAALRGRAAIGGGQLLDVSCAQVLAALFTGAQNIGAYAQDGRFERRSGSGMSLAAPATILPCKDGHVWLIALEAAQWRALARVMGSPEWACAELFDDMFERGRNQDLIYALLREWTASRGKQEIMDSCQAAGIPTTAVYTIAELASHPHLRARGALVDVDHPRLGRVSLLAAPVRLPLSPAEPPRPAPRLDEHAREIRAELEQPRPRARAAPARVPVDARALPLAGLRVANFGWSWVGPVAGQTLALLGAEVLKIESRARVDINRTLPPFAGGVSDPDRSLQNHAGWAGNGSVALDLKRPEAQELARELVARCDIVLENFSPGVMERLGLGYSTLAAKRPELIMVSMPGAGRSGPLRDVRTYGVSLGAIAGIDSLTGYRGGPPIPMENAFADPLGGIVGAYAALLALHQRDRSGRGQHVDCSQQDALLQFVGPALLEHALGGRTPGPLGNRHPCGAAVPHGVFPAAGEDRWIAIAVLGDAEFGALAGEMGRADWVERYARLEQRRAAADEIEDALSEWTRAFEAGSLAARLQARGVAATPVLDVPGLLADPQHRARETFIEVEHPLGFRETIYGAYIKTSRSRPQVRPGPAIGQDNDHAFRELLGLSEARYRELIAAKVIY